MCVDQVVAGPSAVWVPLQYGKAVARIDPTTNAVTADTPLDLTVGYLAVDATNVWVGAWNGPIPCTDTHAVLDNLDPASGKLKGRLVVPCAYIPTIVSPSGDVWLGTTDNPNAVRLIKPHP